MSGFHQAYTEVIKTNDLAFEVQWLSSSGGDEEVFACGLVSGHLDFYKRTVSAGGGSEDSQDDNSAEKKGSPAETPSSDAHSNASSFQLFHRNQRHLQSVRGFCTVGAENNSTDKKLLSCSSDGTVLVTTGGSGSAADVGEIKNVEVPMDYSI